MSLYLITGGAGFIGSHIARRLVKEGKSVRIFDNFSTGKWENLEGIRNDVDVVEGDLRDEDAVRRAVKGCGVVFHEAALASVPRSVANPGPTNDVNITGMLNLLTAARDENVSRFVFASSSSVYGNSDKPSKSEEDPTDPLSPYAITKRVGEMYGLVFHSLYELPFVAIRYFNVFGPYQDEDSDYAAVIPIFTSSMLQGKPAVIYGNGEQSRDFTFVSNIVDANLLAVERDEAVGQVINVACDNSYDLNYLVGALNRLLGTSIDPVYEEPRAGDVMHSRADIRRARKLLGFDPKIGFDEGLESTVMWYRGNLSAKSG